MFKSLRVAFISVFLTFLLSAALPASAQSGGAISLGDVTYARVPARVLRQPVNFSTRFFRGVGGVAFSAVADGQNGMIVLGMRYDASARDGDRLVVTVSQGGRSQTVRGYVHDWALVPTARFALDENGSAMTLFGRLENEQLERQILQRKGRVINYHPALDNTLLGLRMFHADILIIQQNAVHLFKRNGQIVVGAGEVGHNPAQNMDRFRQIVQWQQQEARRGNQFQSYVVGDLYQRVTFAAYGGRLSFTGAPYWAAWRPKHRSPAHQAQVQQLAQRHNDLVRNYNSQVNSFNARRSTMSSADRSAANASLQLTKSQLDTVTRQYEALTEVEQMTGYSQALSARIQQLGGINPVVYRALTTVMHYRALFKHYQRRDGAGYAAFVRSLDRVAVYPGVETPTVQN